MVRKDAFTRAKGLCTYKSKGNMHVKKQREYALKRANKVCILISKRISTCKSKGIVHYKYEKELSYILTLKA